MNDVYTLTILVTKDNLNKMADAIERMGATEFNEDIQYDYILEKIRKLACNILE